MLRDPKIETEYQKKLRKVKKTNTCPFCDLTQTDGNIVFRETKHFRLINNIYPYAKTKSHNMIITKDHYISLNEMSDSLRRELYRFIEDEIIVNPRVQILLRGPQDKTRTVEHFHLHIVEY